MYFQTDQTLIVKGVSQLAPLSKSWSYLKHFAGQVETLTIKLS